MNISIVTASIDHGHRSIALVIQARLHNEGYKSLIMNDVPLSIKRSI